MEGMKAAMLAAANENGNSTVVLKCEVSKNLVKCSTYLAATINEGDPEAAAVALANGYPVMSSSPDDFKQELNGILPFVRPTIYNVEEIQEQYCDSPYYTSGDTSGASSPKMCYPHQPMMHTVYLTSCGPQGHQLMPQNSGEAYPSIVNGEYFPVEVQPGTCQQVYYPYQDQQHWAYHQVTNTLVSGGTTEEGSCGPTSPRSLRSNSDQFSYCYDGIVEGRPPPLQAEYNNHNNSPHQVAQKVAPHLSRTYPPPYRGYASQMRPSVNVHQAPLYVYQPNSLTTSPASSQRVFYPPPTPSSSYQYDKMSAQICYSPQVAQAVYFPQQNYQPQMYNIQGSYTYPGPGQGNMDMSYSPNSTIQSCSSYSSMADVNTSQKKGQIESMRQKSAATLEKLRTLI